MDAKRRVDEGHQRIRCIRDPVQCSYILRCDLRRTRFDHTTLRQLVKEQIAPLICVLRFTEIEQRREKLELAVKMRPAWGGRRCHGRIDADLTIENDVVLVIV
jgi:hypothetical protein